MSIRYVASSKLPTRWGEFILHGFEDLEQNKEHIALSMGDLQGDEPVLARIHSECLTGDSLFSQRCDCGPQLEAALQLIAEEKRGIVFYLRQEGRGIGLLNKIRAYALQDQGADTVEANNLLGFEADLRDYSVLKPMIAHFNIKKMRLMTNNPAKIKAIKALDVELVERLHHQPSTCIHNQDYLAIKKEKLGHLLELVDTSTN